MDRQERALVPMKEVEETVKFIERNDKLEAEMLAEAKATAEAIIHDRMGPDHKALNIKTFYDGLVHDLLEARRKGQMDHLGS